MGSNWRFPPGSNKNQQSLKYNGTGFSWNESKPQWETTVLPIYELPWKDVSIADLEYVSEEKVDGIRKITCFTHANFLSKMPDAYKSMETTMEFYFDQNEKLTKLVIIPTFVWQSQEESNTNKLVYTFHSFDSNAIAQKIADTYEEVTTQ